ncbi:MAG: AAA family ATPase [Proteobacteria bacterium]|nr:AAA family ATPase [Pseudomonadota bacterium]
MQSISEDDLSHRLVCDNPWWDLSSGSETKLETPFKRDLFSPFFRSIQKLGHGEDLILAGCLGVGKTVMLRQAIAGLIDEGASPTSVLYCCLGSPVLGSVDLNRLLEIFMTRYRHAPETEVYLFLDEIQYNRDWQDNVRAWARAWPKARFIGAASSGAPAFATGPSTFVLPPSTFSEFLRFRGTLDNFFGKSQPGSALVLQPGTIGALNEEFCRYVNGGGFLGDGSTENFLNNDLASLHGISDTQELNRLFAILAKNTGLEVSLEELTKALGVAKNTLRKYLDYLERAFLIRRLPRVDQSANRFKRAVAFKVYVTTPCLYAALFGPVDSESEVFARLAETALVSQWLGSVAAPTLGYASWRGGAVDLLTMDPDSDKPSHVYEIDWADAYAPEGKKVDTGPKGLSAFVAATNRNAKAYVLTRENTRQGSLGGIDVTLVPLSLYAYWLARDPTRASAHAVN